MQSLRSPDASSETLDDVVTERFASQACPHCEHEQLVALDRAMTPCERCARDFEVAPPPG